MPVQLTLEGSQMRTADAEDSKKNNSIGYRNSYRRGRSPRHFFPSTDLLPVLPPDPQSLLDEDEVLTEMPF